MKWFAIVLTLVGCSESSKNQPTKPAATPPTVTAAKVEAPTWDPSKPVELSKLDKRRMFVTAQQTSVCPTREQATARKCGNSVEFVDQGTRESRGTIVTVIGPGPEDGLWKAIRFQKAGTLPAWVRADDVAEAPILESLDQFDARADVKKARAADALSAGAIAKLPKNAIVSWKRNRKLRLGLAGSPDVTLFVPAGDGVVAVEVPDTRPPTFMMNHQCMIYGDCLALAYVCKDGGYCDEVSILARSTGETVSAPADEEGEWPKSWSRDKIPLLRAVAVADRFGLFVVP